VLQWRHELEAGLGDDGDAAAAKAHAASAPVSTAGGAAEILGEP
jgi:hypothetical protein